MSSAIGQLASMPVEGYLAVIGASLPSLWLFIQKLRASSANTTTDIKAAVAQTEVIELLRSEVERLGEINGKLATSLNELQLENYKLKIQISELHATISDMSAKLNAMSRREPNTTNNHRK
jgi:predicted RNase H-like nuclease (RuvC/YqgF family)